jgi:hypothetical protein
MVLGLNLWLRRTFFLFYFFILFYFWLTRTLQRGPDVPEGTSKGV